MKRGESFPKHEEGKWTNLNFGLCALHIFTLCSLAIAKPLFDVTAKDAAFYVVRGSQPIDIVSLIVFLCVFIPFVLVFIESFFRVFGSSAKHAVHLCFILVLISLYGAQFLKNTDVLGGLPFIFSIFFIGILGTTLYARTKSFRRLITIASPVCLIFPLLFVYGSQVGNIIRSESSSYKENFSAYDLTLKDNPPIVFILLDELPLVSLLDATGKIDAKRFPNIAKFADTSHWFPNTTTVSDSTTSAVPAILTGIHPKEKLLPTFKDNPNNIFILLGYKYKFHVWEAATQLCPPELSGKSNEENIFLKRFLFLIKDLSVVYLYSILPSYYTKGLPSIDNKWGGFWEINTQNLTEDDTDSFRNLDWDDLQQKIHNLKVSDRPELFRKFFLKIHEESEGTLNFIHLMLPHGPYQYLPSGKRYHTKSELGLTGVTKKDDMFLGPQGLLDKFHQLHLLQLSCLDHLLGEMFAYLKNNRIFDKSLIVITSDHGANFVSNDTMRRLSKNNLANVMFVPLLIKLPKQKTGVVNNVGAETVDILPSIFQILGIKIPWKITGKSLFSLEGEEQRLKTIMSFDGEIHVYENDYLLRRFKEAHLRNIKIFDLNNIDSNIYWFGSYIKILGKEISNYKINTGAAKVSIEQSKLFYENFDIDSDFIPAAINGYINFDKNERQNKKLAVTLNGIIQDVVDVFSVDNQFIFTAIIPEESFHKGRNILEFYTMLENANGKIEFFKILNAHEDFKIDSEYILSSDGKKIKIISNQLSGSLDILKMNGENIKLSGWAADIKNKKLADYILIFNENEFLESAVPRKNRPDVGRFFKNTIFNQSGFDLMLPSNIVMNLNGVRVFVVVKDFATEVNYPKNKN